MQGGRGKLAKGGGGLEGVAVMCVSITGIPMQIIETDVIPTWS